MVFIFLALAIFLLTLTLVIWQPRGVGIGWPALGGAGLALLTGVVHLTDVVSVFGIIWDATLTFVALIIISLILDDAGFFEWAALHAARFGRGDGRRAFVLIILLGALVAAFFANDGAALILTPIVYEMTKALHFDKLRALPFVIASGFIADTASLPLVVSNLVNIVSAEFFSINFIRYMLIMAVPTVVSVAASVLILNFYFRRSLPERYDQELLKKPVEAIKDRRLFAGGWIVLGLVLAGYFAGALLDLPVSLIAGSGALILLVAARRSRVMSASRILRSAPWHIVFFSLGMYVVVYGLRNAGLTNALGELLSMAHPAGVVGTAVATGFIMAATSAVMNNMPAVMVGALAIEPLHTTPILREAMVYANIIGADLGPKFTPLGSLATLLWLHVLENRGVKITWAQYFRVGMTITPPVLLITLISLGLWLWVLSLFGVL